MAVLVITGSTFFPPAFFDVVRNLGETSPFNVFSGKEKFLVELNNVAATGAFGGGIRDRVRSDSGKYWVESAVGVNMPNKDVDDTEHFSFSYGEIKAVQKTGELPSLVQKVTLKANKNSEKFKLQFNEAGTSARAFDFNKWNIYANQLIEQLEERPFSDHAYKVSLPYTEKQAEEDNALRSPPTITITPEYNYYVGSYEESFKLKNILENVLPNLYSFGVLSRNNSKKNKNPNQSEATREFFRRTTTLNNIIRSKLKLKIGSEKESDKGKVFSNSRNRSISRKYFSEFGAKVNTAETGSLQETQQKFSNIVFPYEDLKLLEDYNEKKDLFPMYVELEISAQDSLIFTEALKDSKLTNTLIKKLLDLERTQDIGLTERQQVLFFEYTRSKFVEDNRRKQIINEKVLDVNQWLSDFQTSGSLIFSDDLNTFSSFMGENSKEQDVATDDRYKFFRALTTIIFRGKLNSLTKDYARSYEDIMNGKLCYAEPFMYKVSKFLVLDDGTTSIEPIQRYYFPNALEIDVIRFVDTQIKYDVKYRYKIEVFNFIIGSSYRYENFNTQYGSNLLSFDVALKPSIVIIGTDYGELETIVVDDPPVPPDINFVPLKGVNNKLKLWLSKNQGDYMLDPVFLGEDPDARKSVEKIRAKQNTEGKLRYKSDDSISKYEIYRLNTLPTSYNDFEDGLIQTLDATKIDAFLDTITPNQKYYYIFRVVDIHNNYSNPTPVFEIELVDNSGAVYLVVDVVEFAVEDIPKKPTKSMRKYIQINPAFQQAILNIEKSGLEDAETAKGSKPVYGIAEESVFEKKFKVRFTSKHTGKQFDINLVFKTRHANIEDDEVV